MQQVKDDVKQIVSIPLDVVEVCIHYLEHLCVCGGVWSKGGGG